MEAIERARRGDGPTLIEAQTYRFRGHSLADPDELREKKEKEYWQVQPLAYNLNFCYLATQSCPHVGFHNCVASVTQSTSPFDSSVTRVIINDVTKERSSSTGALNDTRPGAFLLLHTAISILMVI